MAMPLDGIELDILLDHPFDLAIYESIGKKRCSTSPIKNDAGFPMFLQIPCMPTIRPYNLSAYP